MKMVALICLHKRMTRLFDYVGTTGVCVGNGLSNGGYAHGYRHQISEKGQVYKRQHSGKGSDPSRHTDFGTGNQKKSLYWSQAETTRRDVPERRLDFGVVCVDLPLAVSADHRGNRFGFSGDSDTGLLEHTQCACGLDIPASFCRFRCGDKPSGGLQTRRFPRRAADACASKEESVLIEFMEACR